MRAIKTTPTAIIQQIKNNLRDNYAPGFPVLKELLQNADDAEAGTLTIAFVDGLEQGAGEPLHPLLTEPALIVINDGRFLPEDAEKIALMGEGNKGNKLPTIGKFGLGLKSIFHLCESFFYVAHPDVVGGEVRSEFINAWADTKQHPEWKRDLHRTDVARICSCIRPVLVDESRWFCLWIPLRNSKQLAGTPPLIAEFPGDKLRSQSGDGGADPFEMLFHPGYDRRIAAVLPLMKQLRSVRTCAVDDHDVLQWTKRVELSADAVTTKLQKHTEPFIQQLKGLVTIENCGEAAGSAQLTTASYCGLERWLKSSRAEQLHAARSWPTQTWTDADSGDEMTEREKAIPHVAAFWEVRPALDHGRIRIIPSVFLPLADAAAMQEPLSGTEDVDLVLHGYFFVDAGRRGVDYGDGSSVALGPGEATEQLDEQAIRRSWNRLLRDDGLIPLILPALDRFAMQQGRDSPTIDHLTEALCPRAADGRPKVGAVARYVQQNLLALCRHFQWVKRLRIAGARWELVPAVDSVFSLPRPRLLSQDGAILNPLEVIPGLETLLEDLALTVDERWLSTKRPEALAQVALSQLLTAEQGFHVANVFADPLHADYFLDVVEHVQRGRQTSTELDAALIAAARAVLRGGVPDTNAPLLAPLRRLVAAVSPEKRLKLPCRGALLSEILAVNLQVLIVPNALEPSDTERLSSATLSAEDATSLLRALANAGKLAIAATSSVTSVACHVLGACMHGVRDRVLEACKDLRLFEATQVDSSESRAYSFEELRATLANRLLFSAGKGGQNAVSYLKNAIASDCILLVDKRIGETLFGEVSECGPAQCIRTLQLMPKLQSSSQRAPLVAFLAQNLFGQATELWNTGDTRALRYLLHENVEAFDDDESLFQAAQKGPWAKLLKRVLKLERQDWRVISADLTAALNALQSLRLNLQPVDAQSVSQHLQSLLNRTPVTQEMLGSEKPKTMLSRVRLDDFSDVELTTLFDEFPLQESGGDSLRRTLRALPLHRTLTGERLAIERFGYLDDPQRNYDLDEELRAQIVLFEQDSDPVRAAKQRMLFGERRLTSQTIVGIAAAEQGIKVHWSTLLCALSEVRDHPQLEALRVKSWVPTRDGFVAPIDVPYIPDVDLRQELPDIELTCEGDLLPEFREHRHFAGGRKLLLRIDEAFDYLGKKLRVHDHYLLGPDAVAQASLSEVLRMFEGDGECMPCRPLLMRLIERESEEKCRKHLIGHLLGPIRSHERWIAILNHLARRETSESGRAATRKIFALYLEGAKQHPDFARKILPKIRLLNSVGRWRSPSELCVDCPGVDSASILDAGHAAILGYSASNIESDSEVAPVASRKQDYTSATLIAEANASAALVKRYFSRWSVAPPGAVAGLLCLFGDHPQLTSLVEELVQPRLVRSVRDMLPWHVLQGKFVGAGLSSAETISRCRFLISLDKSATIHALNLLGQTFAAPIAETPEHLLMGKPEPVRDRNARIFQDSDGNQYHRVVLRNIETEKFSSAQASDLLRETAQLVLRHVYWQWEADLQSVWQTLSAADQLDISVTQQILLDRAPANLPKLRTDKLPSLRKPLRDLDEAFHRLEEAKQSVAELQKERIREAERTLENAKQILGNLLTHDAAAQAEVVEALREKVRESGYLASSIPFELLQNADDASLEYYEMYRTDEAARPDSSRFVVTYDSERIYFLHWGRPINKYRHESYDGSDRGFRSDLSKMLALGESDKLSGIDTKKTTGRFGLGFKSVFLATDRPRVVSGWLAFQVVAGIYPQRLEGEEAERLRNIMQRRGPMDGTLVELELSGITSAESDVESLSRFLKLAHLLVICTRQVRSLELEIAGRRQAFSWKPDVICGLKHVKFGQVRPWKDTASPHNVLVLGEGRGALLLRMDGFGFTAFDADVPTMWVTAPTVPADDFGVIVNNGDFDLDPGRTQLQAESHENLKRAATLGVQVGEQFVQLFDASVQDWSSVRSALKLESGVTSTAFWESLFTLLVKRFSNRQCTSRKLLCEVLWADIDRGMRRLLDSRPVVPTGLPEPYAEPVCAADIRYTIDAELLQGDEPAFARIIHWPSLQDNLPPGNCVSHAVYRQLAELGAVAPAGTRVLGLVDVVAFEMRGRRITTDAAARLATVIQRQHVEACVTELRRNQSNRLGELLLSAEFQACDGHWRRVNELLAADDSDELLRAAFAPDSAILAAEYQAGALEFVRLCRGMYAGRMRIGVKEMLDWAVSAEHEERQIAVLRYLVEGAQADGLGKAIREWIAQDPSIWPASLDEGSLLQKAFPDDVNRQQLVLARLGLVKLLGAVPAPIELEADEPPPPPDDPEQVLRRIAGAWRNEAGRHAYELQVYSGEKPPQCTLDGLSTDLRARKEWIRLLITGALHTIGLSSPSEYGNFLKLCEHRGWLDVFADPQIDSSRWLDVLDKFLDPAVRDIKYYRSMQRFIGIYQFARHLRDYAHCFGDMNRGNCFGTLSQVLRSRENPLQAGGGADAPPLTAALGIGACFVVRELVHGGFLQNPHVHKYCYVPVRRVVRLLIGMGCSELKDSSLERWELSAIIHRFLCKHLGEEDATFGGDFDLPLLAAVDGKLSSYGLSEDCERFVKAGSQDSEE